MTWQPIETAPRDGTVVLLYRPPGVGMRGDTVIAGAFDYLGMSDRAEAFVFPCSPVNQYDGEAWWNEVSDDFYRDDAFTHWMPLPAQPDAP